MRQAGLAAAAAVLFAAAPPSARPADSESSTRIAFASNPPAPSVPGLRTLGRLDAGAWFSADTAALLALWKRDTAVWILFHDEAEYRDRMQGLASARRAEKVREALESARDNGDLRLLEHCARRERTVLAAIASESGRDAPGDVASAWKAIYHAQIQGMSALEPAVPEGRQARDLLTRLHEMLEGLNEEAEVLGRLFPGRLPALDPSLAANRDSLALELKREKARLPPGGPEPAPRGPPQGRRRGWHVTPYDSALAHPPPGEDRRPALRWKDGVVTVWEDWLIPGLEKRGFKSKPLYLDEASLRRDLILFDPAQLPERFRRQQEAMGGIAPIERLAFLQLELVLDGSAAARDLAASHGKLAGLVRAHLREEGEALRSLLARHPVWRADGKGGRAEEPVRQLERQARELEFALAWARLSGWTDAVAVLEEALKGRRGMILRARGR